MGCRRAAAHLALNLVLSICCGALVISSFASAFAADVDSSRKNAEPVSIDKPADANATVAPLAATPTESSRQKLASRNPKAYASRRWLTSVNWWQETEALNQQSTSTGSNIRSSIYAVSEGYQWRWQWARWGFEAEADGLIGQSESVSRDPNIVYFHNQDFAYGLIGSAGAIYVLERPRVTFGAALAALCREVNYAPPSGFSFGDAGFKTIAYVRFEISVPISKRFDVDQTIAFPLSADGTLWTLGVRY